MADEIITVRQDIDNYVKDYMAKKFDYIIDEEDDEEIEYRLCVIHATLSFIKESGQFN